MTMAARGDDRNQVRFHSTAYARRAVHLPDIGSAPIPGVTHFICTRGGRTDQGFKGLEPSFGVGDGWHGNDGHGSVKKVLSEETVVSLLSKWGRLLRMAPVGTVADVCDPFLVGGRKEIPSSRTALACSPR